MKSRKLLLTNFQIENRRKVSVEPLLSFDLPILGYLYNFVYAIIY